MALTPDQAVDQFNTEAALTVDGFTAESFRRAVQFIQQNKEELDNLIATVAGLSYQPLDAQLTSVAALAFTGNANKVIAVKADESTFELVTPASGGGYGTVEDEGTPLTQRSTINFTGAGVSVADAGSKTVVTISGGGGGLTNYESRSMAIRL
jgi:hypothetical protein